MRPNVRLLDLLIPCFYCPQAVQSVLKTWDPIEHVKTLLTEHGLANEVELKDIEKRVN